MAQNREHAGEGLQKLADGVYAFLGQDGNSNYGVIETEQGLVIIDNDIRSADRLQEAIRSVTAQEMRFLINTHNAFDHASANYVFARAGATIISSAACRQGMAQTGRKKFEEMKAADEKVRALANGAETVLPGITFDRRLTLHLGSRMIELIHFGHGHTPGDIVVHLPQEGILFSGDLIVNGYRPQLRDGSCDGWLRILEELDAIAPGRIVPGHGPVTQGREGIRALREYFLRVKSAVAEMAARGKTLEEILEEFTLPEYEGWGKMKFWPNTIRVVYRETVG